MLIDCCESLATLGYFEFLITYNVESMVNRSDEGSDLNIFRKYQDADSEFCTNLGS